jgi:hypothetical protein
MVPVSGKPPFLLGCDRCSNDERLFLRGSHQSNEIFVHGRYLLAENFINAIIKKKFIRTEGNKDE